MLWLRAGIILACLVGFLYLRYSFIKEGIDRCQSAVAAASAKEKERVANVTEEALRDAVNKVDSLAAEKAGLLLKLKETEESNHEEDNASCLSPARRLRIQSIGINAEGDAPTGTASQ